MIAGLPITGIGGIFYLLLALFMPVREFWMLVTGRSCLENWKMIGRQLLAQTGVVVTVALQAMLITKLAPSATSVSNEALGMTGIDTFSKSQTAGLIAGSTLMAIITLGIVFLIVRCLQLYFQIRRMQRGAANAPAMA